jgi:glycerol-3-phosphate O-acyltransferase/dihydroxyacetone phosphate acyltransferase
MNRWVAWAGDFFRPLVRRLARIYYPRIEVTDRARIPKDGPVLLAANHPNSLLDPIMIGITAQRPVRFLAKAPLFDVPVLGSLMRALGMLPAYRGSDDPTQVRRNVETLDAGADVLVGREALGIFPEGKTHDLPAVEQVRTGAGRIAMLAVEKGARELQIVPLGINYEDKERVRSAVWVRVGEPIAAQAWLEKHGNDSRHAMRQLTHELDRRLKDLAVHLNEKLWEPYLKDLEYLLPPSPELAALPAGNIRQRKRIADAMNYFQAADRPRADQIAARIGSHQAHVAAAQLEMRSPVLSLQGWRLALRLLWEPLCVLFWLPLALIGTIHHIVPFLIVRVAGPRLQTPGRTTVSLARLGLGIPIYALWYALLAWWWLSHWRFTPTFVIVWNVAMPFAGLFALSYWPRAVSVSKLWTRDIRLLFRREELRDLRRERHELRALLRDLAAEYARACPPLVAEKLPTPPRRWPRRLAWSAAVVAPLLAAWCVWVSHGGGLRPEPGLPLGQMAATAIAAQLEADEAALHGVLSGLEEAGARATQLRDDFATGRRSYLTQENNDAVRRVLLSFITYRAALLGMVWRYQQAGDVKDSRLALRAFLCGSTATAVLHEKSLQFVVGFNRSPESVRKLNEGDAAWGIPDRLYDTIRDNLRRAELREYLAKIRERYAMEEDAFRRHGLADGPYADFHEAFRHAVAVTPALEARFQELPFEKPYEEAKRFGQGLKYSLQSVVATWIGDQKIREPHRGQTLIGPKVLAELRARAKPGDILIERHNWFLSNAFLPGYWPHAALYVGTAEDVRKLGLDKDERVAKKLAGYDARDTDGNPFVIIEAMSEGVIYHSFETSVGESDAIAVLRPRLPEARIHEAICRAFSHAGKPYDFEFDFFTTDKIVCTELVFRGYDGAVNFQLVDVMGRKTLPAIEIVKKFANERGTDKQQLDLIAYVGVPIGAPVEAGAASFLDEDALVKTRGEPGLDFLVGLTKTE